ncbi:MAG TPA: hypothetical protein VGN14_11965 [Candidatus Elarobacter sp.]
MRPLLFCAHPGHELRVFGWLKETKPVVCFLTDGSAGDGVSRAARSDAVLTSAGATMGPIYAVASDRAVYEALLAGNFELFRGLARRLAAAIAGGGHALVLGDAAEGYNPSHDLARMLLDAATGLARRAGAQVVNCAFPVVGDPHEPPAGTGTDVVRVRLDDATLREKIERSRTYAQETGGMLVSEVDEAIERFGIEAFREERLFDAGDGVDVDTVFDGARPFYETYGEQQVAAGRYSFVIRWREHVRPVAAALRQLAASS